MLEEGEPRGTVPPRRALREWQRWLRARAGEAELLEVGGDGAAGVPIVLDEGDALGAAREGLEAHRTRAGIEVEHRGAVDRADQVVRRLAHAVAGRAGRLPFRRGDAGAAPAAGDDPHVA